MSRYIIIGTPNDVPRVEEVVRVAKGGNGAYMSGRLISDGAANWMHASGEHGLQASSELPAAKVAIHPEALARLQKEAPSPELASRQEKDFTYEYPDSSRPLLSGMQTRAIIFVRVLTILNGNTHVRPAVLQKLVDMLNAGHNIRVYASERDETILSQIIQLITSHSHGPPVRLTQHEHDVLSTGQIPTVGLGAMTVVAARGIQKVALAVSALTCEALQSNTSDIQMNRIARLCSPDAVQIGVRLQELLSGSELVDPMQGGAGNVEAISMVPAVHGELDAAITRCEEAVTVALRNILTDPMLMLRLGPTIGLPIVLLYMSTLLVRAAELSLARADRVTSTVRDNGWIPKELQATRQFFVQASALRDAAQQVMSAEVGKACFSGALAGWAGVTALLNALAMESAVLLLSLREQDIPIRDAPPTSMDLAPAARQRSRMRDGGPALGFGTSRFRLLLEDAVTDFSKVQQVAQQLALLRGGQHFTEPQLRIQALLAALDPIGEQLPREMADLQDMLRTQMRTRTSALPRGTQDFLPEQVVLRQDLLDSIAGVFRRHGAVPLDTPALVKSENQTNAFNDDPQQIFDLKKDVAEMLSLRYDLTVSFARFVAQHNLSSMKCYQISRVYRKEAKIDGRGRFREFYQCDFDIAGNSPRMVADAEALKVLAEVLDKLALSGYTIRISHRLLLRGILRLLNVPKHKHENISLSLDQQPLSTRRDTECMTSILCDQHNLDPEVALEILKFVRRRGKPFEMLAELRSPETNLAGFAAFSSALDDLEALFYLLQAIGCLPLFEFDLAVVGSLDYYTGIVFEAFCDDHEDDQAIAVGLPIAAGGRYDDLIGTFGEKQVRAVGFSFGFDRIFPLLLQNSQKRGEVLSETKTQVLVMSVGKDMQQERLKLASELWAEEIGAEFTHTKANPFLPEQINHATTGKIPLAVIMAPRELAEGKVELLEVKTGQRSFVPRAEVVGEIGSRLVELGQRLVKASGEVIGPEDSASLS